MRTITSRHAHASRFEDRVFDVKPKGSRSVRPSFRRKRGVYTWIILLISVMVASLMAMLLGGVLFV